MKHFLHFWGDKVVLDVHDTSFVWSYLFLAFGWVLWTCIGNCLRFRIWQMLALFQYWHNTTMKAEMLSDVHEWLNSLWQATFDLEISYSLLQTTHFRAEGLFFFSWFTVHCVFATIMRDVWMNGERSED